MLKRFHEELTAWSEVLASPDRQHVNLKAMLADPEVAVFLASRNLTPDDELNDKHFDDYFCMLEATKAIWAPDSTVDEPHCNVLND